MDSLAVAYLPLPEYRPGPLPDFDENAEPFDEEERDEPAAVDFAAAAILAVEEGLPDPNPLNQPIYITSFQVL